MTKTIEDSFYDWEAHVFGFGYGTGERHTFAALKQFLALVPSKGGYDYEVLEFELGPAVAWLLINILARADILEYGTSPRYAWLTNAGRELKSFVGSKTLDELLAINRRTEDYVPCYPDACNCGPTGYVKGAVCQNPFWDKD